VRHSAPSLLFGAFLAGCGPSEPAAAPPPPSIELLGAETFDFQDDRLRAHGFADRVLFRRDTGDGMAERVRLTLFSSRPAAARRGASSVELRAPIARGNPIGQEVAAEGGVQLASGAGDRGETARAAYHGHEGRAAGRDPVHLWGPGYDLHAPGFTLDTVHDRLDLGRAELVARGDTP
jgi:hypothetical protein